MGVLLPNFMRYHPDMRYVLAFVCATMLWACGPAAPERAEDTTRAGEPAPSIAPSAWAICDSTDRAFILIYESRPEAGRSRLIQWDKTVGAATFEGEISYGPPDAGAGSIYTPYSIEGAEAGFIRQINPGMLETPGSAYTLPLSSAQLRGSNANCRWLPRTRLIGVTEKRSLVVHEDADGDLVYTTYDFSDAASRTPIELSENGRSTTFSAEVRDGQESLSPQGASFRFSAAGGYEYRVLVDAEGPRVEVWRDGALALREPFVAYQIGEGQ